MGVDAAGAAEGGSPSWNVDAVFRSEADPLFRTLCAFTGGRSDIAEEAMAEAFARAIASRDDLRDPTAWIYRVAFRVAIDEIRRETRRDGSSPDRSPDAGPELDGVMEALRHLSPNQRAAVTMRYVLDLDTDEIAARMGIARSTVRVHLHRATKRLGELLGAEEVD